MSQYLALCGDYQLTPTVYEQDFGVHQWNITVAHLNSLLKKVNQSTLGDGIAANRGSLGGSRYCAPLGTDPILHKACLAITLSPPLSVWPYLEVFDLRGYHISPYTLLRVDGSKRCTLPRHIQQALSRQIRFTGHYC